jgi:hypothetical protein
MSAAVNTGSGRYIPAPTIPIEAVPAVPSI